MKKIIENIKNIWRVEELRKRLFITFSLILVFRIGSFIILPGVDSSKLANSADAGTIEGLLGLLSGGGFTHASFMALGIMPYISASIIMQLLGMAVPAVQKMQEEGESGQKKINNYTRILTIIICAVQAPGYLSLYVARKGAIPAEFLHSPVWWIQSVLVLVAGAMMAVWIGERITDRGVGNGISLLITVGIISRLPSAFIGEVAQHSGLVVILEIVGFTLIVMATVLIVEGVRKIPMNYAKRVASVKGGAGNMNAQGARSYIPIKVNASGVMPIIFAQAIMTVPVMLLQQHFGIFGFWYNLVLGFLIIIFTYFYTAIMINPKKMADDLKRNGGFIPGIRPGNDTANYIDGLVSKITLPGSIFLAIIAIVPAIVVRFGVGNSFALFFGGTSLLIMVAVILDTLQQIESYLLNRHYDGLMEGTKIRGRRKQGELSGM